MFIDNLPLVRHSLLVLLLIGSLSIDAQTTEQSTAEPFINSDDAAGALSIEKIQARKDALAANSELSEAERQQLDTFYQQALDALQEAQASTSASARYQEALEEAPAEIERLQQSLRESGDPLADLPANDSGLKAFEERLLDEQTQRATLRKQLETIDQQLNIQRVRPDAARLELTAAQQKKLELDQQLQLQPDTEASVLIREARRTALSSQHLAVTQNTARLQQELSSHEIRLALLNAQRALLAQQINASDERIGVLQERINAHRREETEVVARETATANIQARSKPKVVRDAADANLDLSRSLTELIDTIDEVNRQQKQLSEKLQQIETRYQSIQQQLLIAGLNDALGPVLRQERRSLPNVAEYQRDLKLRQQRIVDVRLKQFQIDEQRQQAGTIDEQINGLLTKIESQSVDMDMLKSELRQLLTDRESLLVRLSDGYATYIRQLAAVDNSQRQLVQTAERYRDLLDENLFWIASAKAIDLSWLTGLVTTSQQLALTVLQLGNLQSLAQSFWQPPLWVLFIFLVCAYLVRQGRRLRHRLTEMAGNIGKVTKDRFTYTFEALVITILMILPWPLLIGGLATLLLLSSQDNKLIEGISYGFYGMAFFIFFIISLRQLCRANGLAALHLNWPVAGCRLLRRHLGWYLLVGGICAFFVAGSERLDTEIYRDSLGRLAFMIGAGALTLLLARVLHPKKGVFSELKSYQKVLWSARYIWYPLLTATPLALLIVAASGYYYTALQLLSRFFMSLCLLIAVAVLVGLVLRWLRIEKRRLAWNQARTKREAILAARSKEGDSSEGDMIPNVQESELLDLDTVSEQTQGLLHLVTLAMIISGLWWLWADLIPAFTFLNKIVLWQQGINTESGEIIGAITLGNLVLSLVVFGASFFIARNLPGLLEVAILQRLAMDAGNRYAVTTIIGYLLTIIGVLIALNTIGVSWEKAQWLVAALGVGLGFGLQEIFANFVSGLILLLERPLRVGNIVTLGNLTGTVTRIRIRATTITDFDNKEIIVPNKTFITESLTNWNLSEPITRVIIPVKVAYGSDTTQVHQLLSQIVDAHPLILKEPEAAILLMSFADSALIFEVRVFVREILDRLTVTHELHEAIHRCLRENGIEIPLPQRDLHVRTIPVDWQNRPADNA